MAIYTLKLIDKRPISKNTIMLIFEKPEGLTYKPGQYGGFTLINPPEKDAGGVTRRFSLLSTPDDPHIAIATRLQNSAYKRVLNNLQVGDVIKFAGPTGNFTLHDDEETPAVLMAGGIGIAPFYCMVRDAKAKQRQQKISLFYGNQDSECSPLLSELQLLAKDNPYLKLIATMASPEATWAGETGFISEKMVRKYVPDIYSPIYYICGSPAMVTTLQEMLAEAGVDEERIKVEDFPGY